ncbi:UDP-N-acetylmuramate dehydrogenase [Anoxynatronum buryatiense]|uniref:UDP-N-acetylenolpyruvoylglucosamine reductase n=1 Tax=Anoxynatronum buryatiense TaxID=489973 RepID=A0AA46AI20_9CLOT|nr:UDP-N-acetylmuramate dehydrogenase [Anoxynatronum buryatiense]SMP45435.1 UDP-N-acetylmuramate dehydrogenase [Anoxynatronum buryatiense]
MIEQALEKALKQIVGETALRCQEPMKAHTSFQIGGPADYLAEPGTEAQLADLLSLCQGSGVPVMVIGKGSNMLVSDTGIRGVVIKIGKRMNRVTVQGQQVNAQAGATLSSLSRTLLQQSMAGFEFAAGIPGTLGGALAMNAGAYGGEMKDILVNCRVMNASGIIQTLTLDEMHMGYRSSRVQKTGEIILSANLALKSGVYRQIKFMMDDYWQRRVTRQPYYLPSGGSVFKRPEGYFAGKLIEDCQLKGVAVGGAMVSELHAGFIVNTGDATAADVVNLMNLICKRVKETHGVDLEAELRVIGA